MICNENYIDLVLNGDECKQDKRKHNKEEIVKQFSKVLMLLPRLELWLWVIAGRVLSTFKMT